MPLRPVTRTTAELAESIVEPETERLQREDADSRSSKLDRQRQTVNVSHDVGDERRVVRGQGEHRIHGGGAVDEEAHCFRRRHRVERQRPSRIGDREGRHLELALAPNPQERCGW